MHFGNFFELFELVLSSVQAKKTCTNIHCFASEAKTAPYIFLNHENDGTCNQA